MSVMPASWAETVELPASREPMTQDAADGFHDDVTDAYLEDHSRVTEFLALTLAHIKVSACSGVDPDNLAAAAFLERLSLRAKSGPPPDDFDPDDFGPERHRDIRLEDS